MAQFLYEKYDGGLGVFANYFKDQVPNYINENLRHELREYQLEGIGRYLNYAHRDEQNRTYPEQLLFNMATGSGKTMMMAAIILEKYKQGERNFLFFVNNSNIIEKTRANFLDSTSGKYLFADSIMIADELVEIREVTDFSDSNEDAINLLFTTIQQLHIDLNTPRENRLSYEQFEDISVVMLADEAHHLNAGLNADEKKDNTSWTATVDNIQRNAKKSSLFEFTATIDLSDSDIVAKYREHLLYKYDLKDFRLDGYSKDVLFHLVNNEVDVRMLQAIIISQFRKKVALKNGINLKPLILFKSQKKTESAGNLSDFLEILDALTVDQIEQQKQSSTGLDGILTQAFDFFDENGITHENLIAELKEDFREERLMLIDSDNKTSDKLVELNTLEDPKNEIRAIFAVDMLNEGWDVLNLFDIVRLYDTRDGKTTKAGFKPGATTNAEKQLIGRGARYYPFVINNDLAMKYKRKFDHNEAAELRVIEQLHYHSKDNPRYISELKQVLRESGIYDDQSMVERQIKLKRSFRKTGTYKNGVVWVNSRVEKPSFTTVQGSLFGKDWEIILPDELEVHLPTSGMGDFAAFEGEDREIFQVKKKLDNRKFKVGKEITLNVLRAAVNLKNKDFNFEKLHKSYVGLPTLEGFLKEIQNKVSVIVFGDEEDVKTLSQDHKLFISNAILQAIADEYINVEKQYEGTLEFEAVKIKDVFEKRIQRKYVIDSNSNKENGISQKELTETRIFEDIDKLDWYAYTDNFGTSEEKLVVRTIKQHMAELETKLTDIYLLRNEKAIRIYSFDKGNAFEPDFIMFANDAKTGNVSWQFFIEPKGSQFLDSNGQFENGKEGWKQAFLKQIKEKDEDGLLVDDNHYRIVGLPFYNHDRTRGAFLDELRTSLNISDEVKIKASHSLQGSLFDEYEDLTLVAEDDLEKNN
ncbi:DEAD/DEAH box helicase family protein [Bacillus tropicus]|nr:MULTISPECIES: DEAD/DEAH box helicase family protein [Bacillus cereus group]MBM6770534.1 DEAD/DEAH box helicase family protein [Bacillus cereus]MCC2340206.1 DEAD/DEAH box helicase family protein [Bacillus tropicus]MCU5425389.1 DEAD/DEAH box helicase family protein [Bacillus tropicus]MCU5736753.1 DEAD/DEAH box helicase family protein [Bacillus mobilis]MCU9560496.1 DEAD/DEAH box helicase family protein [Bacillus mobilis]